MANNESNSDVSYWVQIMLSTDDKPFEGIKSGIALIEAKEFASMLANGRQIGDFGRIPIRSGDEIRVNGDTYRISNIEMIVGNYPNGVDFHTVVSVIEV